MNIDNWIVNPFPTELEKIKIHDFIESIISDNKLCIINGTVAAGKSYLLNLITKGKEDKIVKCLEPSEKWDFLLASKQFNGTENIITDITMDWYNKTLDLLQYRSIKPQCIITERSPIDHIIFRNPNISNLSENIDIYIDFIKNICNLYKNKYINVAIITLYDDVDNITTRVKLRGRSYEQNLPSDYFYKLQLKQLVMLNLYNSLKFNVSHNFYVCKPILNNNEEIYFKEFTPNISSKNNIFTFSNYVEILNAIDEKKY